MSQQAVNVGILLLWISASGCSLDSGTLYAPLYKEERFGKVVTGMSSNTVVGLLGRPLGVSQQQFSERWIYGQAPSTSSQSVLRTTQTIPAPALIVFFSEEGVVVDQIGGDHFSLSGNERHDVIMKLGAPSKTETNFAITIFSYTQPKFSGSHHVRAVLFDSHGSVVDKKSFYYRD